MANSTRTVRTRSKTAARSTGQPAVKRERLHLRLDSASRHKIEQAAHFTNKTASDFVVSQSIIAADKIIESHTHTMTLSASEWDKFCRALDNPPKAGRRLMEAARRYNKRGGELAR